MAQVVALTCPVCSGPLNPEEERCNFCGSYVVIKTSMPRLSRAALNQSLIQEHIDDFRNRTRSYPYDVEAHYGLGLAYYSLGLINDSISELTEAARLTPENPNIQAQLAVVLRESWRAGNADAERQMKERLHTALLLDPEHSEANTLKMQLLLDSGNLEQAVRHYNSLPGEVQDRTKASLIAALERQGQHNLRTANWDGARWCWQSIEPLDSAAAQRLQLQFLRLHESLVPSSFTSQTRGPVQVTSTSSRRILGMSLAAIAGLCVGFLQFGVIASLVPTGENGKSSGFGSAAILLSFLLLLAAPVIAAVWYRRRGRSSTHHTDTSAAIGRGSNTTTKTKVSRKEILAGLVDSETLQRVVDLVMAKVKAQELQRAQQATAKRS